MCHNQIKFLLLLLLLLLFVNDADADVVVIDPKSIPLKFSQNQISNRWNIVDVIEIDVVVVVDIVVIDARNLPLRFG